MRSSLFIRQVKQRIDGELNEASQDSKSANRRRRMMRNINQNHLEDDDDDDAERVTHGRLSATDSGLSQSDG